MTTKDEADRFLADCVRRSLAGQKVRGWPADWRNDEDLIFVTERADLHGIGALLGASTGSLDHWPTAVRERIAELTRLAALWEMTHKSAVASAIGSLAESGILSVVMKGTALAYQYYADPCARRRGDTDLLIRPEDLEGARKCLDAQGFVLRRSPHGLRFQETWQLKVAGEFLHSIDLHWVATDRPVLQKVLPSEDFWKNTHPLEQLSVDARAPEPAIALIHGAINMLWHQERGFGTDSERVLNERRLIWMVDFALIFSGFDDDDWRRLLALAEDRHLFGIVRIALDAARSVSIIPCPAWAEALIAQAQDVSPVERYVTSKSRASDLVADIRASDSLSLKLRLVLDAAFVPRDDLIRQYPSLSTWPTFALQMRRYARIFDGRQRGN
ncbi:nucleotidyltransferase family protein [Erythrobacter sp. THAF29]|uniref:nucleotidyltransferase family protein n=1 Tax=Erythrobacter sp. THAF29 TaxID=2587851 RepID=UPI001268CF3F|nr:nucleotidyltransferase family protein [Erythrobacter sp. THAF29]QFT75981.1 hypothetical protein FIU90_00360 [Erythrobacter sp. THAF29]